MKNTAFEFKEWPTYLRHMRSLCGFFRNDTYRRHIVRMLAARHPHMQLTTKLASFSAKIAKWRFETVPAVQTELLDLRALCEGPLDIVMFNNAQDRESIVAVFTACKCPGFWRWMRASYDLIFGPIEHMRRWGLLCPCCEQERHENPGKKIPCPRHRESRRLHQAWRRAGELSKELRVTAAGLTLEQCGGDGALLIDIHTHCLYAADLVDMKVKHLNAFPWILVRSIKKVAAERIVKLATEIPSDGQDPFTRWFLPLHWDSIQAVAAGGEPTAAHLAEIMALTNSPIDESAAEGYHRQTTLVKTRAAAATLPWVIANARFDQNLQRIETFIHQHGGLGKKIVCFEWLRCKRLLQVLRRKRWTPLRCKDHVAASVVK